MKEMNIGELFEKEHFAEYTKRIKELETIVLNYREANSSKAARIQKMKEQFEEDASRWRKDITELENKLKNAEELKREAIGIAELEIKKNKTLKEENEAIRALMNSYNLGGWTDAIEPMKRALEAESHEEKVVHPLVVDVKGFQCPECFQMTGIERGNKFCHSCGVKFKYD